MKRIKSFVLVALLGAAVISFTTSCNNASDDNDGQGDTTATATADTAMGNQVAEPTISNMYPDTSVTGTARFEQNDGKVKLTLNVTIPSKANKSIAVHIHETGDCGDTAKKAGPHWNPGGSQHGKWGVNGFHAGDIGNITLDGEGKGSVELETDMWSIGGDSTKNILNRAVVVHGKDDDFKSQPAGNAGTRIGCGVITKTQ